MRWLAGILLLVLLGLQYRLWVGDGSLTQVQALKDEIIAQKAELKQLRTRNQALEAEVQDLREGLDALEERARSELGMIKHGELFLQVIEEPGNGSTEPGGGAPPAPPEVDSMQAPGADKRPGSGPSNAPNRDQ
jgi:cell division protein FtsB